MATVVAQVTRKYKDLDLAFTMHPVRKDVNKHVDDLAVINSVKNLISTSRYERPFQPNIGSNVRRLLFESLDNITATSIESEIRQTILNYEPRVNISKLNVVADYDNNGFKVLMQFFIANRTTPITINFFLERIR